MLSKRSFEEYGLAVNITTLHDYVYSGRDETFCEPRSSAS